MMVLKKTKLLIFAIVILTLSLSTCLFFDIFAATASNHNYAEALQKSIYFYDAQKCGSNAANGLLEWRGACHTEDQKISLNEKSTNLTQAFISANKSVLDADGDGYIDLSGGFHDAGDFVKFGLPESYSASTLGWGFYKFRDAYKQIGSEQHMLDTLRYFSDYFLKSTFIDKSGNVIAFNYMVGQGASDHVVWIAPELQDPARAPRIASFSYPDKPASDQSAGASAALSLSYINFKDSDSSYANKCLTAAKALYTFAKKYRGLGNGDGFYGSGGDEDELSWAAVWLYEITKDTSYINDIMSVDSSGKYTGFLGKIRPTKADMWQNSWVLCWDSVWAGVFTELAGLFPDNKDYDEYSRWNIEFWSGGKIKHSGTNDSTFVKTSPAGFSVISTWGSARYNCGAQLCAMIYQKEHPKRTDMSDWAKSQMDYILGDNPMGYAYEVGFGDKSAQHPHHRAAHGSLTNDMNDPPNHKHTLWGALVGGPDTSDFHKDITSDYVYNEVAIDYNAAFVGALAGQYLLYGSGQKAIANFPPKEVRGNEYYMEARIEKDDTARSEIHMTLHSECMTPPTKTTDLSCKYFFNISELAQYNLTINDLMTQIYYDEQGILHEGPIKTKGPFKWDNSGTYYIEFDWSGYPIIGKRVLQFVVGLNWNSSNLAKWDISTDWSAKGLTSTYALTKYIPVYRSGVKVFGEEPPKDSVN
jgi:endoglucanase